MKGAIHGRSNINTTYRLSDPIAKVANTGLTTNMIASGAYRPFVLSLRNIALFLFANILLCLPVHASKELRMGYIEFPPHYYTDDKGAAGGLMIDLARTLAKQAGYTVKFKALPANRLVKYLVDGDLDLFMGLRSLPKFTEGAHISSMPVGRLYMRAYSLKPLPPKTTKEDLVGKRVLVMRGYSYGDWLSYIKDPQNEVDIRTADTHLQALQMIEQRRIDFLLDYKLPVLHAAQNLDLPPLYSTDLAAFDLHIIISKKTSNSEELMLKFEEAFNVLFPAGLDDVKGD